VSGVPPKNSDSKGTAVKKSSQIQPVDASAPAIPERVSVAMTEIAENMHEGLLALAVGAGLQVMVALMEADVTVLAGPKGTHNMMRSAVRHGRERGVGDPGRAAGAGDPPAGAGRRRGG
jgi:putative transposase